MAKVPTFQSENQRSEPSHNLSKKLKHIQFEKTFHFYDYGRKGNFNFVWIELAQNWTWHLPSWTITNRSPRGKFSFNSVSHLTSNVIGQSLKWIVGSNCRSRGKKDWTYLPKRQQNLLWLWLHPHPSPFACAFLVVLLPCEARESKRFDGFFLVLGTGISPPSVGSMQHLTRFRPCLSFRGHMLPTTSHQNQKNQLKNK